VVKKSLERLALRLIGHRCQPATGYIDADETVRSATAQGLTVSAYVEALWDQEGNARHTVEAMRAAGCLPTGARICEIGPGTGRYLELAIEIAHPRRVEFYELADDWASWLASTYGPLALRQPCDGRTLAATLSGSCDLVHAHGVFTYLPAVQTFEYLAEIVRVCAPGGHVVFDVITEPRFGLDAVDAWVAAGDRYPVIVPRATVEDYFARAGFRSLGSFTTRYGPASSEYMMYEAPGPAS
jgi:SAM-dependent methyltransferase